jgi:hypothetical protein
MKWAYFLLKKENKLLSMPEYHKKEQLLDLMSDASQGEEQ